MNKARGGDAISAELFQILKDGTVTVLHSICQQIWKTQQFSKNSELERVHFHSNPKEGQCQRMLKLPQLHSSHMLAKQCSKFSKPGFNST